MAKRSTTAAATAPVVDDDVPAAAPKAEKKKKDDAVRVVSAKALGNFSIEFELSNGKAFTCTMVNGSLKVGVGEKRDILVAALTAALAS